MFMNHYRESSMRFLYATIFPFLLMGFLFIANKKQMCFGLGFCYLMLVISVTMPIAKRRKEIKEIQKNGICYVGNIENLVEVKVETTFNRFGHAEYDNAYCLKVVLNEKNHFVYSDVLVGRKGQKVSKEVLVYDWYGKTFVVCTEVKENQNYKVEQKKEVIRYSWNRKCLIYINRLIAVIDIVLFITEVFVINF